MVESMKELADYAEQRNGSFVIEAIDRFESNYLRTGRDVLGLIERVGSDRVLVHLDTYHMNLEEHSWRKPFLECGKKLGHVHVADNTRWYPGHGLIDFRPVVSYLLEIGYTGSLTMECYPFPDGETAALLGKRHLEAVMAAYAGN
jgi:sugar phosphate isomerase/epimerase